MISAPGTTLADHIGSQQTASSKSLLKDGILIVGASLLMALAARASIYLPLSPVPITLQTLVVMLAGATLGSRRGALAMLLYLVEGAVWLPVFAGGGGILYLLLSPTAGYLWSYPLAALAVGYLCERNLDRSIVTSILAVLPGTCIIYALGVPWLAVIAHLNLWQALSAGMFLFLPGDIIKVVVAAILMPAAWQFVRRLKPESQLPPR
jgi:biotin transport system substrate-specific component